ncbi:MAG: PEP-CTERM sorting domain-containing protein [Phycisphaerales bacterium]
MKSTFGIVMVAACAGTAFGDIVDLNAGGPGGRVNSHAWGGGDALLWNNGPVSDGTNGSGFPISTLFPTHGTFGFGAQIGANNGVAEDFTVGGPGWNVNKLTFFMYQTGATAFTFTGLDYQIVTNNADPIAWTSAVPSNGGLVAYRAQSTTPDVTNRPIFALEVPVALSLSPGNYFMRWRASGSLASGPWQPPVAPYAIGNATQSLAGGAFGPAIDALSTQQAEFPFQIDGTVIPAPASLALLSMGGLVAIRRRRA